MSVEPQYQANRPLYYYTAGSGVMPQLAYREGDLVPAGELARNPRWQSGVTLLNPPTPATRPAQRPGRK